VKILHFNTLYDPYKIGGAELSVQILLESLRDLGCQQSVVSNAPYSSNDSVNRINVIRIPSSGPYFPFDNKKRGVIEKLIWHISDGYLGRQKILKAIIESEKPDIIHTHNFMGFGPALFKTILESDLKWIHTIRDFSLICPKTTMFCNGSVCRTQCFKCKALRKFSYFPLFRPDTMVGISKFILDSHLKHMKQKTNKHLVIFNPIPRFLHRKAPTIKNSDILRIGFIGRLEREKGINLFLDLIEQPELKGIQWIVAGRGDQSAIKKLKQLQNTMHNFQYLGFCDPSKFYSKIDIVCVPSIWNEPFGRIPIEASMFGVFPIVSENGGLTEVIKALKFGEVAKSTVSSFLTKIQNYKNGCINLSKPDFEAFESYNIAQRYYDVYTELCSKK